MSDALGSAVLIERCSKYFPPAAAKPTETEDAEKSTDENELAAKLPDAPTTEPQDPVDLEQPSPKKQKVEIPAANDEELAVVDKEEVKDAKEETQKADL